MKQFKIALAPGESAATENFFKDSAGKLWPIYRSCFTTGALTNAGNKNVAHGLANIKLDGHLAVTDFFASAGAGGVTARTIQAKNIVAFAVDGTNVNVANTTDLTAQTGQFVLEYCLTTDATT